MNKLIKTLQGIPFFAHLSLSELMELVGISGLSIFKKGQSVLLKKSSSLYVVISGIFEVETFAERDVLYLPSGAFFGSIPFADIKIKGEISAMTDAEVLILPEDALFRFLFSNHRLLRGYLRILSDLGYEINESARSFVSNKTKVITIYGRYRGVGKTFLSTLLGLAISDKKKDSKTIMLDLSYAGKSFFDYLNCELKIPISVKSEESDKSDIAKSRIVPYSENLHLLNVSNTSKIKTEARILKPLLLSLVRDYNYIIIDLSNDDPELRDMALSLSDIIFVITSGKRADSLYRMIDNVIKDCQRVVYVRNSFIHGSDYSVSGGLILQECNCDISDYITAMENFIFSGKFDSFLNMITGERRAIAIEPLRLESILLSSFICELSKLDLKNTYIYSSSWTFILIALSLLIDNYEDLKKAMMKFYSPEQINKNLAVVFPKDYVFSSDKIIKYAMDLASSARMEFFSPAALGSICVDGAPEIKSTGYLWQMIAASFISSPEFQPLTVDDRNLTSGYPYSSLSYFSLYRTDINEIYKISVKNKATLTIPQDFFNNFYSSVLNMENIIAKEDIYLRNTHNLILDVSESEYKFDRIFESTLKSARTIISKL